MIAPRFPRRAHGSPPLRAGAGQARLRLLRPPRPGRRRAARIAFRGGGSRHGAEPAALQGPVLPLPACPSSGPNPLDYCRTSPALRPRRLTRARLPTLRCHLAANERMFLRPACPDYFARNALIRAHPSLRLRARGARGCPLAPVPPSRSLRSTGRRQVNGQDEPSPAPANGAAGDPPRPLTWPAETCAKYLPSDGDGRREQG